MKKFLVLIVAVLFFGISSCGTLIKNGQGGRTNQLDVGIVVLDTLGLLLFVIPGVVSFIVDFNNRTIYK